MSGEGRKVVRPGDGLKKKKFSVVPAVIKKFVQKFPAINHAIDTGFLNLQEYFQAELSEYFADTSMKIAMQNSSESFDLNYNEIHVGFDSLLI